MIKPFNCTNQAESGRRSNFTSRDPAAAKYNPTLLYMLGTANLQIGQHRFAVRQLQQSLILDPRNASAHSNHGLALKELKRLDEAMASFDRAIATNPRFAEAHYNRGNVLMDLKRLDEALASYDRALAIRPDFAEAYGNRGNVLKDLNRPDEALASYEQALANKRDFAAAHNDRGVTLQILNRLNEALTSYDQALALKPGLAEAHYNRGNVLKDLNRLDEALASYDRALAINPGLGGAYYSRCAVLRDLKRLEEALASYDQVLAINPKFAEAHNERGVTLSNLKRLDEALASFDRALAIKPDFAKAHNNRGATLLDLRRLDEALASFDRALAISPDYASAHNGRGNVLAALERPDEALASYDRALAINPHHAEAYYNRGNTLAGLKRLDEALESYNQALAINPDFADVYWNKALLLLMMGEFLEGWELYEWRLKKDDIKGYYYSFPQPSWRGREDIRGKRLFIHAEQGLGDVIQFCRYLPLVKALGAEIIFEVPKPLVPFISTLDCPMSVVAKGTTLPEFDAYCPLMSLPHVFKITAETVPAKTPYLFSDRIKVQQWQDKLGQREKPRVGLAWSGSITHKRDVNRSVPLQELPALIELPVEWHSLQKEYRRHDLELLELHPEIRQHQDDLRDFADTAALIECLDLVISVDTSVAHVAGAMGTPVWILLPFAPDFRWMLDREDSPWYPTATLFRQPRIGDWQSVVARLTQALRIWRNPA